MPRSQRLVDSPTTATPLPTKYLATERFHPQIVAARDSARFLAQDLVLIFVASSVS
jgi:hypothetical protein